MLTIKTFESSSSGNLHLISNGSKKLLVECGLSFKKIKQYLDFDLDISGCLLSHYHADHSKSAKKIMRAGIDLYCSKETAENMRLDSHRLKIVRMDTIYIVDGFRVLPFQANHDTPGALGYLIDIDSNRIMFATDTGSLPYRFKKLTHIIIECNHSDESMTDVNPVFVDRVKKTHMGLNDCIEFLERNDLSRVVEIRLIHLSSRNADADYFKAEIQKLTGIPTIIS